MVLSFDIHLPSPGKGGGTILWVYLIAVPVPLKNIWNICVQNKRSFLRGPPAGVQFHFDYIVSHPVAMIMLDLDPNLKAMRFDLVPKQYVYILLLQVQLYIACRLSSLWYFATLCWQLCMILIVDVCHISANCWPRHKYGLYYLMILIS